MFMLQHTLTGAVLEGGSVLLTNRAAAALAASLAAAATVPATRILQHRWGETCDARKNWHWDLFCEQHGAGMQIPMSNPDLPVLANQALHNTQASKL